MWYDRPTLGEKDTSRTGSVMVVSVSTFNHFLLKKDWIRCCMQANADCRVSTLPLYVVVLQDLHFSSGGWTCVVTTDCYHGRMNSTIDNLFIKILSNQCSSIRYSLDSIKNTVAVLMVLKASSTILNLFISDSILFLSILLTKAWVKWTILQCFYDCIYLEWLLMLSLIVQIISENLCYWGSAFLRSLFISFEHDIISTFTLH